MCGIKDDTIDVNFQCYQSMEKLLDRQNAIQKNLANKYLTNNSIILYNITSSYLEGEYKESEIVTFGYNRDKSKTLLELEQPLNEMFEQNHSVMPFMKHIHQQKLRYYRDQLGVIKKLSEEWNTEIVIKELKSNIIYLNEIQKENSNVKKAENRLPAKFRGGNPETRDLSIYENAMGIGRR